MKLYFIVADWAFGRFRKATSLPKYNEVQLPELKKKTIWFHVASVGELESLVPVIQNRTDHFNVVLSVFSRSAAKAALKLGSENDQLIVIESPKESEWKASMARFQVQRLVSAKYEAWPGLWSACSEKQIPIFIVSAKLRPSLKWVKRSSRLLGFKLPKLFWFSESKSDLERLLEFFPNTDGTVDSDPRWDRVHHRLMTQSPMVMEFLTWVNQQSFERPWGIFGSAWANDLEIIFKNRNSKKIKGTWFVVPHHVSGIEYDRLMDQIRTLKQEVMVSFPRPKIQDSVPKIIVINQMGLLTELYSILVWVYVGGGFNAGIHSTIEPALSLKPMICGPKRADYFSEIAYLERLGLLKIIHNTDQFWQALEALLTAWSPIQAPSKSDDLKSKIDSKLGSSSRIAKQIFNH